MKLRSHLWKILQDYKEYFPSKWEYTLISFPLQSNWESWPENTHEKNSEQFILISMICICWISTICFQQISSYFANFWQQLKKPNKLKNTETINTNCPFIFKRKKISILFHREWKQKKTKKTPQNQTKMVWENLGFFCLSFTTDFLHRMGADETPHAVPQPLFVHKSEDSSAQAQASCAELIWASPPDYWNARKCHFSSAHSIITPVPLDNRGNSRM